MSHKNYGTYQFPREPSWIERHARTILTVLTGISIGFAIGAFIFSVLLFL